METQLYKLIGEVMDNAELHGTENERYSVGFFEKETSPSGKGSGIFSFSIFNFGKTIYEVFKDPNCPNQTVVEEMRMRSQKFLRWNLFSSDFEEETLWTLYALQEGVTSIASKKRGHGTIRLIEAFFSLQSESPGSSDSRLKVISGNTEIEFDGIYQIKDREKKLEDGTIERIKIMAFNDDGDLMKPPNKKYVKFANQYFPGTMITLRVRLEGNLTSEQNEQQHN